MGATLKMPKDTEVRRALKAKVKASFSAFRKDRGLDMDVERFNEDVNMSTINGSRLLWLKELEKGVAV